MTSYYRLETSTEVIYLREDELDIQLNNYRDEVVSYQKVSKEDYDKHYADKKIATQRAFTNIEQKRKNKEYKKLVLNTDFEYKGYKFQMDDSSRLSITGKLLSLNLNPDINEVSWITNTKDSLGKDVIYTFSKEEFIEFALLIEKDYEEKLFSYKKSN